MGRCGAPCEGLESREAYGRHVAAVRAVVEGDCRDLVGRLEERIARLAGAERYEDAGHQRDRLAVLVVAAARMHRLAGLARVAELVAARRTPDEGWEVVAVRHGRLAGTDLVARGVPPWPAVDALLATAERVPEAGGPVANASAEEGERVLRWLEQPGVRLVHVEGSWWSPAHGAGSVRERYASLATPAGVPAVDRRGLRPVG
jgi:DNA polymerase-3 subunit epsilon